ncbi:tryptophan--tRNA ligase, cytoplasmic [Protomyces lactucae-debilis]|uniref:Tryptophan--tRNA ligase, cytoplasmic n=1 Tax=Protomyces lactucae-debilis TaxID=2754530 RepID=A0A1Y2FKA7_PROLT|nr:tryptophan--tRNA ligase, cytoplasmic [Protomyces lactucae-debilis]ORY83804.1 tryptophan--tRNA ligase, cytoplasmic [Protomyces lactucae-debilis]
MADMLSADLPLPLDALTIDGQSAGQAEQNITPWEVEGAIVDGKQVAIDYGKLIKSFGTKAVTPELLQRFETLTGHKPHPLLRRGAFFSHRDLDLILDRFEKKEKFYLYTGRGPSADSMHLGHMIPFAFTCWLQKVFDCPLVIQLTDDEKFLFKQNLTLEDTRRYASDNARDIIAVGFDLKKTFIFANTDYVGGEFYKNVVRISRSITINQSRSSFGFEGTDCIGKAHFVAVQAAPAISSSFPQIFGRGGPNLPCLIPCAIDQDPYFRLTRDVATRLQAPKCALLHSVFFPALQGPGTKMSASIETSAIFMNDTPKRIKDKINKHAYSGGGDTLELHRQNGGNPDVDVPYQFLTFFLESDEELAQLKEGYKKGEILTGEMKRRCIEVLQEFVSSFQQRRAAVSDELLAQFMDGTRKIEL